MKRIVQSSVAFLLALFMLIQLGEVPIAWAAEEADKKITAERVAESDLSVRDTEKLVKRLLTPAKTPEKHTQDEQLKAIYQDLEEQLKKAVGTKVSIRPLRGKKGSIEIEYYSDEDLERIIDRLRQS